MKQKPHALVWRFEDAPSDLQSLTNRDDADWIVELPPELSRSWYFLGWVDAIDSCQGPVIFPHPRRSRAGWEVYIGFHS